MTQIAKNYPLDCFNDLARIFPCLGAEIGELLLGSPFLPLVVLWLKLCGQADVFYQPKRKFVQIIRSLFQGVLNFQSSIGEMIDLFATQDDLRREVNNLNDVRCKAQSNEGFYCFAACKSMKA